MEKSKLYAKTTIEGPQSGAELMQLLKEEGMLAAAWLVEKYEGILYKEALLEEQISILEHENSVVHEELNEAREDLARVKFELEQTKIRSQEKTERLQKILDTLKGLLG